MKLKLVALILFISLFSSCVRKEYASFRQSPAHREPMISQVLPENSAETPVLVKGSSEINALSSVVDKKIDAKRTARKEINTVKHLLKKEIKQEIKDSVKKKDEGRKEMNPKLSRALWLLIPGGLATLLGILLYGVAPTGLFIFAFGLVFLVGLVSLILYWINPKPKM